MRKALAALLFGAIAAITTAANADPITYSLTMVPYSNGNNVGGTITTDGNLGEISASDITSWSIWNEFQPNGVGGEFVAEAGSVASFAGGFTLTATASGLYMPFASNYPDSLSLGDLTITTLAGIVSGTADYAIGMARGGGAGYVDFGSTEPAGGYLLAGTPLQSPSVLPGGGGPTIVGGAGVALSDITGTGSLNSNFYEPGNPSALATQFNSLGVPAAYSQISFMLAGTSAQLWDIAFSGTFTGDATVTLHFDPSLLGNTPLSSLEIEHYTGGHWVVPANQVVDTVNDTITFTTDSFSPFILADIATPEPSSVVLLGLGAMALAAVSRRRIGAQAG